MSPNCWLIRVNSECAVCGRHQYTLSGQYDISPGDILIFYYNDAWSEHNIACCLAIAGEVEHRPGWDDETAVTLEDRTSIEADLTVILQKLKKELNINIPLSKRVTPVAIFCEAILGTMLGI